MGRSIWRMWSVTIIGGLIWTMPVSAQQRTTDVSADTAHVTGDSCLAMPTCAAVPAAVPATVAERLVLPPSAGPLLSAHHTETRLAEPLAAPAFQRNRGPGYALAIAGGALFVAGLIAGDDEGAVMMIVGGGVGAYGLYLMFR